MAYVSAADLKTYLGVTGAGDDALLAVLITGAQQAVDNYCRRTFEASADSTRYYTVFKDTDNFVLWLDEDLCAITSITNGDSVAVAADEYTTIPKNETPYYKIKLLASGGKSWTYDDDPEDAITIVGKFAYSTTAPADIVQATKRLAAFYYRQKDSPLVDVTAIEAGTVIRTPGMPPDVKALLMPYRVL